VLLLQLAQVLLDETPAAVAGSPNVTSRLVASATAAAAAGCGVALTQEVFLKPCSDFASVLGQQPRVCLRSTDCASW